MVPSDFFEENQTVGFKREIPKKHERFLKDVIAFSNTSGGRIVVGVEDETGTVIGIGDRSPHQLADTISKMIFDSLEPQIVADIYPATLEEKTVIFIDVPPGKFRPYYLKNVGFEKSTYVRINGISVPATERMIRELQIEGKKICYDTMIEIGLNYNEDEALKLCREMKKEALKYYSSNEENKIYDIDIQKLEDFGVLKREGSKLYPTHAFTLLTQNNIPFARIQCARFKDDSKKIFTDKREFSGPLYQQLSEAYKFVLNNINLSAEIVGLYRKETCELPPLAIREALSNALIHRSYLIESCIQVSVFDDRVVVYSPGMLYDGLDIATVRLGTSRCRNRALGEAFRYMRMSELWGTGIPRMIQACAEYGLAEPLFQTIGDGFQVVFLRKNYSASNAQ